MRSELSRKKQWFRRSSLKRRRRRIEKRLRIELAGLCMSLLKVTWKWERRMKVRHSPQLAFRFGIHINRAVNEIRLHTERNEFDESEGVPAE